jgi:hypothetical protein
MKKAVNVSCSDRVKQYPKGVLHADAGQLFCSSCNITLDHCRKGSIDKHLLTQFHVTKRKQLDELEDVRAKQQATIVGSFQRITESRDSRNLAHFELVEAFVASNIPLNKLDHPKLREYLQANVKNLGALPTSSLLRSQYLPQVFEVNHQELKERVAAAPSVVVVTDEASDAQDRFVLHVLFVLPVTSATDVQMEAVTVDLVYLDEVNNTTVSQTIIQTLAKYNVDFNKVSGFVTDNASYMTKAMANLKCLLPNCIHMTCNAHILSLVGETWRKNFNKVDRLVACFKSIFVHCSSRKQRYKQYIAERMNVDSNNVPLPPVPVVTRWNSWFTTVVHHSKYIEHYRGFIDNELEVSASSNALTELQTLLGNDNTILIQEVSFIAESTAKLIDLLTWFEGRHVQIHLAYNRIMDLLAGEVKTHNKRIAKPNFIFIPILCCLCNKLTDKIILNKFYS